MADNKKQVHQSKTSKTQKVSSVSKSSPPVTNKDTELDKPKPTRNEKGRHWRLVYKENEPETSRCNVMYNSIMIKAIELCNDGMTWNNIAKECGYEQAASIIPKVKAYIQRRSQAALLKQREIVSAELEMMGMALNRRSYDGDISAIKQKALLLAQFCQLNGLNSPDKQLVANVNIPSINLFADAFMKPLPVVEDEDSYNVSIPKEVIIEEEKK